MNVLEYVVHEILASTYIVTHNGIAMKGGLK